MLLIAPEKLYQFILPTICSLSYKNLSFFNAFHMLDIITKNILINDKI